jgi:hypothetical protein
MRSSVIKRVTLALLFVMQPYFRFATHPNLNTVLRYPVIGTSFHETTSVIPTTRPSGGITRAT